MRDAEKTIGNMIDKQKICYISSVDKEGFPIQKQCYNLEKEME